VGDWIKRLLVLLTLALPALAQVEILYSPVSPAVSALWGPRNGVYLWNVSVWNHGAVPARLTPEAVAISAPVTIPFVTSDQGLVLFQAKVASSKKAKLIRAIEYGLMGSAAIGGFGGFAVSAKVVSALASGSIVARQVGDKVQASEASTAPIVGKVLADTVTIMPGQSGTWVMFSSQMAKAAPQKVVIDGGLLK